MTEAIATVEHASRAYRRGGREVTAVCDVSMVVSHGARTALVGPSGSGKTTLLHLIGGLDEPTSGEVTWPALGPRDELRPGKVALAFQAPSLLPPLTVEENVAMPLLLLAGSDERAAIAKAREILDALGLGTLGERLPEELSGGQSQRVAMARALVCGPMLVLADEPTGQLDHATAVPFVEAALALLRPGAALIVATHDGSLADLMDDRVVLRDGVVEDAS
jgi:putative ABC transport system ATP-binding protein/lipoprotein-releasing system ATP-binding protein